MVVIGSELMSEALREKGDVPFNPMGVGNAHLDGGKQVVKGDVLVPIDSDGVVITRCRDATIYIASVGPCCILGFPFFSRYGIQVNIDPPCFRFTEFQDVSAPPHLGDNIEIRGPQPPIRVQTPESIGGCFTDVFPWGAWPRDTEADTNRQAGRQSTALTRAFSCSCHVTKRFRILPTLKQGNKRMYGNTSGYVHMGLTLDWGKGVTGQ